MKKKLCMALAAAMAAGSAPAYAAEKVQKDLVHTYTAKVGTTEFYRDDAQLSLDTPIYLKDGYTMLPLRTFLTAVDNDEMHWDNGTKIAWVQIEGNMVVCNVQENQITVNGEQIPVSGKMEIKNGRIFVPLRNWKPLLNQCGFTVGDEGVIWDAATKTAVVKTTEKVDSWVYTEEESLFTGQGEAADYALPLTRKYDDIENIGEGYFIAAKYPKKNVGIGSSMLGESYYLINAKGKELLRFENNEIRHLYGIGNGFLRISYENGKDDEIINRNGTLQFSVPYRSITEYHEGRAAVLGESKSGLKGGFVDEKGQLIVPVAYDSLSAYAEGLAAVEKLVYPDNDEDSIEGRCGYLDKNGNVVIDLQYLSAESFHEGLAAVETKDGWGYIDKKGNMVIRPQYEWVSSFADGKAFVTEKGSEDTWVIDRTGKKLKQLTEGAAVMELSRSAEIVFEIPFPGFGPGDDMTGGTFYDHNGEISQQEAAIRLALQEGLAGIYDFTINQRFYVDANGKQAISTAFDKAEPFRDGYAVVANGITLADGTKDAEWGILRHPDR